MGTVDELEQARDERRERARAILGVSADAPAASASLRATLRDSRVTLYPLIGLGSLAVADTFAGYAFSVLTPEISRALGVGVGAIAAVVALKGLASALAPLGVAALAQRPRRALLSIVSGVLWSVCTLFTGFVVSLSDLLLVLFVDGFSTGSVAALHQPLLLDSYPPAARVRALTYYSAPNSAGNVAAPLLVALLTAVMGFTWRGVFVVLSVGSALAVLVAARLRDPGFGRWDTEKVRASVYSDETPLDEVAAPPIAEDDVELGFFEILRRLMLIPTVRRLLIAQTVFGVLTVPYATFIQFFLAEKWNLGPGARGVFAAFLAATAIGALALFGSRGEQLFRRNPGRVVEISGTTLGVAVVCVALGGLSPVFVGMAALFGIASGLIAILAPSLTIAILSVIPSRMRPHAAALLGIFGAGVGGLMGAVFLGGIDRRYGITGALVALAIPGVAGAFLLRSTAKFVTGDIDRMIDDVIEDEEVKRITRDGGHLPMLSCRRVDFSYGQLQVLFGVDFTVDDGEMVALLGVNGAGKSTLLRVISGIGLPSAGTVRFRGGDITYVDAERRARLGITQVPGGRAVFGGVSVIDNLRGFGYTLGRDRRVVDEAIERCFEAFPRLAERTSQNASNLSGGEQQMLGLARALILQPRLLLIDELSLGLAPVVVGPLLDLVRRINASGTAVVLVEQSVNLALNLVDHAYFMEKGEIRFDGRSQDLLARDDLLRAVFLGGVGRR
jgi:ABC-type branched-subunit amino acid transport system ATPase component/sugar phosphate permease